MALQKSINRASNEEYLKAQQMQLQQTAMQHSLHIQTISTLIPILQINDPSSSDIIALQTETAQVLKELVAAFRAPAQAASPSQDLTPSTLITE